MTMLGLALIAALVLWIIVIALSVWLPQKMFKDRPKMAGIATVMGFMLTFGFWFAKWNIESHMARKEAREMCKKVGVTIYVQPEKWKEMVGGEAAWKELGYKSKGRSFFTDEEKKLIPKTLYFENEEYKLRSKENNKVGLYSNSSSSQYGLFNTYVYYDFFTQQVLYKSNRFKPAEVSLNSGFKMLFFRTGKACISDRDAGDEAFSQFFYITK